MVKYDIKVKIWWSTLLYERLSPTGTLKANNQWWICSLLAIEYPLLINSDF
ncbi:MAG: hypothetical protein V7K89_32695 [Nostoc sp.]|uniref:hypothetical protein n=1 Tax=Nostoc sp. TaxID=1180 RepID=UPI002FF4F6C9